MQVDGHHLGPSEPQIIQGSFGCATFQALRLQPKSKEHTRHSQNYTLFLPRMQLSARNKKRARSPAAPFQFVGMIPEGN